jgi:PAS domain-containing protein
MTSLGELDRFLSDLHGRRNRLLALVPPSSAARDSLGKGLLELSEQLIVADEELRVQQEELDDSRRRLADLAIERDAYFETASEPLVVTDERGSVLSANRAAERLVLRPAARVAPRPIATWFAVPVRAQIRTMIGQARRCPQQHARHVPVVRSDRSSVAVDVSLQATEDPATGRMTLRWRLVESARFPVTEPAASAARGVVSNLSVIARELAVASRAEEALEITARTARRLIAAAEHTSAMPARRGDVASAGASSSQRAERLTRLQIELCEGPAIAAVRNARTVRVDELRHGCEHWPAFAAAAGEVGLASVIAVPVLLDARPLAVVTAYATSPAAFDDATAELLTACAVQLAVNLSRIDLHHNLQTAVQTRQLIGQAVGILIERYKLTPEAAFDILVRASQHRHVKLREVAYDLVTTGQDPA